jgi:hypothetical protein
MEENKIENFFFLDCLNTKTKTIMNSQNQIDWMIDLWDDHQRKLYFKILTENGLQSLEGGKWATDWEEWKNNHECKMLLALSKILELELPVALKEKLMEADEVIYFLKDYELTETDIPFDPLIHEWETCVEVDGRIEKTYKLRGTDEGGN